MSTKNPSKRPGVYALERRSHAVERQIYLLTYRRRVPKLVFIIQTLVPPRGADQTLCNLIKGDHGRYLRLREMNEIAGDGANDAGKCGIHAGNSVEIMGRR